VGASERQTLKRMPYVPFGKGTACVPLFRVSGAGTKVVKNFEA
jgi:hypothetical protein